MNGEIILGRGEYDIVIATGRPPTSAAVAAAEPGPVTLSLPRLLGDGFAFRASLAAPCRISYSYTA
jgi:hypothetical protein